MKRPWLRAMALAFLLGAVLPAQVSAGANLLTNGGFETGNFSGWTLAGTVSSPPEYNYVTNVSHIYGADSGSYYALLGAESTDALTLSQSISTTVGQQYTFSWDLASDSSYENSFTATWNGATISSQTSFGPQGYTLYSFTETATSTSTTIAFSLFNNPGYFYLDNVSVTQSTISPFAVPEPSSLALGCLGGITFIAAALRARRSSRRG